MGNGEIYLYNYDELWGSYTSKEEKAQSNYNFFISTGRFIFVQTSELSWLQNL